MIKLPNRYKECGTLFQGGYGKVIICDDLQLERKVAIKFILDTAQAFRHRDEVLALMSMRSKNVVQLYDVINCDSQLGLVLEYITGKDLLEDDWPRSNMGNYVKTIWQIASGIADIHATGTIHRDIKPNNMKINDEGILKIFDFGLSRNMHNCQTRGFKGTDGFAAPELYTTDTCSFTKAIDAYGFGATALFVASGPRIDQLIPSRFDALNVVPQDLITLLKNCFSINPDKRPLMKDIRNALERHLLYNRHQAIAIVGRNKYILNAENPTITLGKGAVGKIGITYNGFQFLISRVEGFVFINNSVASANDEIPGSCVITFGNNGSDRDFVTFDVSNPEVVL